MLLLIVENPSSIRSTLDGIVNPITSKLSSEDFAINLSGEFG